MVLLKPYFSSITIVSYHEKGIISSALAEDSSSTANICAKAVCGNSPAKAAYTLKASSSRSIRNDTVLVTISNLDVSA